MNGDVPRFSLLKFKTLFRDARGPSDAVHEVLHSQEELDAYLETCQDKPKPRHPVAFPDERAVAVALGTRPQGADTVEIIAVVQETGGFVGVQHHVLYVEHVPHGPAPDMITYPQHAIRVRGLSGIVSFRQVPDTIGHSLRALTGAMIGHAGGAGSQATTLATGEEGGGPTTLATGEETQAPVATAQLMSTLATGEEGGGPTTLATGEEGQMMTTLATGEEGGGPTTLATGEEGGGPTTLATGEEGGGPTTLATGEEGQVMTTLAVGEEGGGPMTLAIGEEAHATTLAIGEESSIGQQVTTLALGEEGPTHQFGEHVTTLAFPGEEGPTTLMVGEEGPGHGGGRGPFG